MSHYKPYPVYKDSGVEWLGEVPEHWTHTPIGYECEIFTGFAFSSEKFSLDQGIPLVRGDNVTEGSLRWGDKARYWPLITDELERFLLKKDDVLIGMDGSKVGKNYAFIESKDLPLLLVQRVARLRANGKLLPAFIHRLIGSPFFRAWVDFVRTNPAIPHISPKDIHNFYVASPPKEEQQQILKVLDRETTRIDALVNKKTRFMELLREKRQALITHAVTKGLDPSVKMKDSGVEWLGDVPEHWAVKRLRFVASINPAIRSEILEAPTAAVSFLPMVDIGADGSLNLEKTRSVQDVKNGYSYFENGDVVFAKVTPCFENGKGALMHDLVGGVGFGTTELTVLRSSNGYKATFLNYLVQSNRFRCFGAGAMTGAGGLKRVPDEFTRNFTTSWPSLDEQQAIATHLDRETTRIDTLIQKTQHSIDLLKERRAALITAAVTGQIDLRQAA